MHCELLNEVSGQNFIGGKWKHPMGGKTISVYSPSDGKKFTEIAASSVEDIDEAVSAARAAFDNRAWSRTTAVERGRMLSQLGNLILANLDTLTDIEAKDTGKPLSQARNDINATARYFEFYGGGADKVFGETIPYLNGYQVLTLREPYGVTAHITPWNYPAQMFGRTLAPALAMGNAVILKPAEDACLSSLALTRLAVEAGFPDGAINLVTGTGPKAGHALAGHPGINFVSFTGSPEVGQLVQCRAAKNHIGCTLELGGKSPQIVFDDADLELALPVLINAIVQNAGQTCSAGSRILVQRSILTELEAELASRFQGLVAGPHNSDPDLGALISPRQKARVEGFLAECTDDQLIAKGKIDPSAPSGGYFVEPALYGSIDPQSRISREEVFGPILVIMPFEDESEALELANSTDYGLVAGVWTRNGSRQSRLAKALRAGQVFINCFGAGGGVELPFGGVGKSGHGREKGYQALLEFSQTKTVVQFHN